MAVTLTETDYAIRRPSLVPTSAQRSNTAHQQAFTLAADEREAAHSRLDRSQADRSASERAASRDAAFRNAAVKNAAFKDAARADKPMVAEHPRAARPADAAQDTDSKRADFKRANSKGADPKATSNTARVPTRSGAAPGANGPSAASDAKQAEATVRGGPAGAIDPKAATDLAAEAPVEEADAEASAAGPGAPTLQASLVTPPTLPTGTPPPAQTGQAATTQAGALTAVVATASGGAQRATGSDGIGKIGQAEASAKTEAAELFVASAPDSAGGPTIAPAPGATLPAASGADAPSAAASPTSAAAAATPAVPLGAVPMTIGLRSLAGSNHFEIRLDPKDLGRIDVNLDIDKDLGTVKAHLVVDRPETLALLQRDAGSLQQALAQTGLDAGDGSINLSLRSDAQSSGQDRQGDRTGSGQSGGSGFADRSDPRLTTDAVPLVALRSLGGIDIRI